MNNNIWRKYLLLMLFIVTASVVVAVPPTSTLKVISAPTDTATTTWTETSRTSEPFVTIPVSLEAATSAMTIQVLDKEPTALTITTGEVGTGTSVTHTCGASTRYVEIINRSLVTTGDVSDILWVVGGTHATATIGIPIVPLGSSGIMPVPSGQVFTFTHNSTTASVPYTIKEFAYVD